MDPEGNKIELWDPVDSVLTKMGGKTTKLSYFLPNNTTRTELTGETWPIAEQTKSMIKQKTL